MAAVKLPPPPTEPGIYWARWCNANYWNYLVRISGKPPFLLATKFKLSNFREEGSNVNMLIFGPRFPERPPSVEVDEMIDLYPDGWSLQTDAPPDRSAPPEPSPDNGH